MIRRLIVGTVWLVACVVGTFFILGVALAIAESAKLIESSTTKTLSEHYTGLALLAASAFAVIGAYRGMLPGTRKNPTTKEVSASLPKQGIARGLMGTVKGLLKAAALVFLIAVVGVATLLYRLLTPPDNPAPPRDADKPRSVALVALASGSKDPLWLALASNDPALVKEKLKEGTDPNQLVKGESLLWYAIQNNWANTALVLVENGADCSQFPQRERPRYGRPLFAAAHAGMEKVVRACLDRGAHNTFTDEDKLKMLTDLAIGTSPEMIRWAVSQGWSLSTRYPDGRSILHVVMSNNKAKPENIRALVELGADLNALDAKGKLPSDHFFLGGDSQSDRYTDIAVYLIDLGADIEPEDGNVRWSVGGNAAFWAIPEIVTAILKRDWSADARQRRCAEIDAGSSDGVKAMIRGTYHQSDTRRGRSVSWKDLHDRTIAAAHAGRCTMPLTNAALVNQPS